MDWLFWPFVTVVFLIILLVVIIRAVLGTNEIIHELREANEALEELVKRLDFVQTALNQICEQTKES
jgi:hypothetical protein